MKMKYCPMCAGVDIKYLPTARDQCGKCKYTGDMREGSMDEINSHRKALSSGMQPQAPNGGINTSVTTSQLKAKLNALKGKSTGDVEFL